MASKEGKKVWILELASAFVNCYNVGHIGGRRDPTLLTSIEARLPSLAAHRFQYQRQVTDNVSDSEQN